MNRQNAYVHEVDGKYYLHYERGDILLDKKTVKLLKKNGFKIRKGEN